jgi:hypothetical protein
MEEEKTNETGVENGEKEEQDRKTGVDNGEKEEQDRKTGEDNSGTEELGSYVDKEDRINKTEKDYYNKTKEKKGKEKIGDWKGFLGMALFPVVFCYLELVFHLLVFNKLDGNVWFSILVAMIFGLFIGAVTSVFKRRVNCVIAMTVISLVSVWFSVQLVFQHIFKTFLSLYSVGENGNDVLEFWKEALNGIIDKLPGIIILLLPIPITALVIKKLRLLKKQSLYFSGLSMCGSVLAYLIFYLSLLLPGTEAHTPYDLYHEDFIQDLGVEKLGMLTATRFDVQHVVFGIDDFSMDKDAFLSVDQIVIAVTPTVTPVPVTQPPDATPTPTPLPTPIPVDTSPNILEIDYATLAEGVDDEAISSIYQYFSNVMPTNKNEYTGMFEGYNLIFLTAEGFSPWAVDETITPTLYKLTHSGFVFENFYTPIWWTSTSDGEYVACTGLVPSGSNSLTKSAKGDMPLCLGWQFKELGYTTKAYHDHTYTYYNRHLTHPNMGYDYKGTNGGGLELKKTWPESDLEMMEVTLPEYINEQPFHTYYMTVSGHMEYTFIGNSMASKNKDYVKDLPYSDNCKAYIACNKEFDLALEYLIKELDKAGVLDKTVIAFSADHYPYGLTIDEISEIAGHKVEEDFELYENYFVLWNAAMKEPIVIDKNCSSMDIMPTLNNLFGIKYDSRLFMGQDILSDAPALVMMSNQSFITDYVKYNSKTGESELLEDVELPENYLKGFVSIVKNKFNVSGSIIKNNFYHDLLPYLEMETYKKPTQDE